LSERFVYDCRECSTPQMVEQQDLLRVVLPLATAVALGVFFLIRGRAPKTFLNKERQRIQIIDVTSVSHDTKRLRLSLGGKSTILGLPVGKHLVLFAPNPPQCVSSGQWNGKPDSEKGIEIQRKYTPVTGNATLGYVDLVVKIYRPGVTKMPDGREVQWDDGGKMSLYLDSKKPGDYIDIKGPVGLNEYLGRGVFKVPGRTVTVRRVAMMAGGTGLTPMLQVVEAALLDPLDKTEFSMIYANKTEHDILCMGQLEEAVARSGGRFKLHYTLDFPPANWAHKRGFITQDMIMDCLPPPAADMLVLICGPPPMVEFACKRNLEALGYGKDHMVMF